jgi:predicted nucleotidyltransferase
MVEMKRIKDLTSQIAREFNPDKIILFGSYAYGSPRSDSDVDLLVVMPFNGNPVGKAAEVIKKINPRFSVDLLVRRPQDIDFRLANNDCFMREVIERGRTLYESSD